jgi:hypothetical protein
MATFFTDLMTSIFTPGPTSSLLLATNVSFAALQVTFLGLLIATFSIHFVVLSVLSGSLWWGINWFVAELLAHDAAEKDLSFTFDFGQLLRYGSACVPSLPSCPPK